MMRVVFLQDFTVRLALLYKKNLMKSIFTALLMILITNCYAQQKEFRWLIGTWKLEGKNIYETWKGSANNTLEGSSYRVNGADTVGRETLRFIQEADGFVYIPDVPGNQGPVNFKVTHYDQNGFVAENPQHDFPKLIRYRFIPGSTQDRIEASIEGDGKVIPFHYQRVK